MFEAVLLWLGPVLEVGILAGLVVRGRWRRVWSLPVLLIALAASATIVGTWPSTNTWRFWTIKESVHAGLFFVVGVEIAARMFARLPGATASVRRWTATVVLLTVVSVAIPPYGHPALTLVPRLLAGAAWLYLAVLLTRILFLVPLDPWHRTVLLGFAPYMMLYAVTWGRVTTRAAADFAGRLNAVVFVVVLVALLVAAWRRETEPSASPETVRFLWPWR